MLSRRVFLDFSEGFSLRALAVFTKRSYAASLFSCSSVIWCAERTAEMISRPPDVSMSVGNLLNMNFLLNFAADFSRLANSQSALKDGKVRGPKRDGLGLI